MSPHCNELATAMRKRLLAPQGILDDRLQLTTGTSLLIRRRRPALAVQRVTDLERQILPPERLRQEVNAGVKLALMNDGVFGVA